MRRDQREQDFTEFFLAHATRLRRSAYVVVQDWHLAEDLTQQAMAKLYTAWPRIRRDTSVAYARRIVINECLSHLRRRRPETPTDRLPEPVTPDAEPEVDLGPALALLPPRQRAIVALRFLDDVSVAEVARVLGITEGTVKSQTARALETLRAHVGTVLTAPSVVEEPR
jgi:RNA polymerase sigma-70 factor (sigma-E family)